MALAEICGSTVEKGGVAGAEFSADVTFSQWFCSLINVCSSLQSLLCLFERNIALQPKIQGNLGDLYAQNDVSVSKLQFRFKVFIPRIPSVFRYRGKSLALLIILALRLSFPFKSFLGLVTFFIKVKDKWLGKDIRRPTAACVWCGQRMQASTQ